MADKPWKREERAVARLLGGTRYAANSGGRVDVEAPPQGCARVERPGVVAQVKHVRRLSLTHLEALAREMEAVGRVKGKVGLLVVKRRAGKGRDTPRLVVLTEGAWRTLAAPSGG